MNAQPIAKDALVAEARKMFDSGQRLLTLSAVDLGDGNLEILYHFDKDLAATDYRLRTAKGESVPSISPVYFCALLIENEIRDQFGVTFSDIVLDFGGTLYLEGEITCSPFCKLTVTEQKKEG